jgi:tetratricopeptide (TPR) repeat protein
MKAILSGLLNLGYKDHTKLINAITCFSGFHQQLGDFSDNLICQTVEFIHERHVDTSLLIRCLQCWGKICFSANNFKEANYKLKEAEMLCSSSITKDLSLHADILHDLAAISFFEHSWIIAEPIIQKALTYFESDKNKSGQGKCYRLLGYIYGLERIEEAQASLKSALEHDQAANDASAQGEDHYALGATYLCQERWNEAEESFKNALKFHTAINCALRQGNNYAGLGAAYLGLNRL